MTVWEYKVVSATRRGVKIKGAKTTEDRFAAALEEQMNTLGAQGWEYVRADTLPCDERHGLTGRTTVYHNLLVFRRPVGAPATASGGRPPARSVRPQPAAPVVPVPEPAAPPATAPLLAEPAAQASAGAAQVTVPPLGPAPSRTGEG